MGRYGTNLARRSSAQLIGRDGSFSQYSLNYHRLMLDTFCIVEIWRQETQFQPSQTLLSAITGGNNVDDEYN